MNVENRLVLDIPRYFVTKRKSICICEICEEPIMVDQKYFNIEGMLAHKECVEEAYLFTAEEEVDD